VTVICAIKTKDAVYLASDSLASCQSSKSEVSTPKVFAGDIYALAFCGSYRFGQVLATFVPPTRAPGTPPEDFMCSEWVDALRDHLRNKGMLRRFEEVESLPDGSALVAYEGGLYVFQEDLAVFQVTTPYIAAGSGGDFAMGALHALQGKVKAPQALLKAAIKAAEDNCPSCGGAVQMVVHRKG